MQVQRKGQLLRYTAAGLCIAVGTRMSFSPAGFDALMLYLGCSVALGVVGVLAVFEEISATRRRQESAEEQERRITAEQADDSVGHERPAV